MPKQSSTKTVGDDFTEGPETVASSTETVVDDSTEALVTATDSTESSESDLPAEPVIDPAGALSTSEGPEAEKFVPEVEDPGEPPTKKINGTPVLFHYAGSGQSIPGGNYSARLSRKSQPVGRGSSYEEALKDLTERLG